MACLEMYNQNSTEQKGVGGPPMSPRISFSNDFADSSRSLSHHHQMRNAYRDAPVSSDFEFSVSNYSMITADELFFKGRLLPLKENCSSSAAKTTTLRDELQNDDVDDDSESFSSRPPKNPARWRDSLASENRTLALRNLKSPSRKLRRLIITMTSARARRNLLIE